MGYSQNLFVTRDVVATKHIGQDTICIPAGTLLDVYTVCDNPREAIVAIITHINGVEIDHNDIALQFFLYGCLDALEANGLRAALKLAASGLLPVEPESVSQ